MTDHPSSLMRAMASEAGVAPGSVLGAEMDAEQLDLLRDPETQKLPANVFRLARSRAEVRGPGRPKGSLNKKSDQFAKLIVSKYGDPVEGMAAIYAMPLDQLVELLLIADGSKDREERLLAVADKTQMLVDRLLDGEAGSGVVDSDKLDRISELVERLGDFAKLLKTKPGELALKALNTQLQARREVAQYVRGKMPVAIDVNTRADVILNIPGLTDPAHLAEYVEHQTLTDQDLAGLEYVPFGAGDDDEGGGGRG